jgi:hypothetical protein
MTVGLMKITKSFCNITYAYKIVYTKTIYVSYSLKSSVSIVNKQ